MPPAVVSNKRMQILHNHSHARCTVPCLSEWFLGRQKPERPQSRSPVNYEWHASSTRQLDYRRHQNFRAWNCCRDDHSRTLRASPLALCKTRISTVIVNLTATVEFRVSAHHITHLMSDVFQPGLRTQNDQRVNYPPMVTANLCTFRARDHRSQLASDDCLWVERFTERFTLGAPPEWELDIRRRLSRRR